MQGTHCISGTGMGVVVATGDKTVFGRIAKLTSQPSTGRTTLEKEIFNFVTIIVSLMLFMIVLVIILWYDSILAPLSSLWGILNDDCLGLRIFASNIRHGSTCLH